MLKYCWLFWWNSVSNTGFSWFYFKEAYVMNTTDFFLNLSPGICVGILSTFHGVPQTAEYKEEPPMWQGTLPLHY